MAAEKMAKVIEHIRRIALLPDGAGLSDKDLLELFISGRDEAAFAALVRRHAAMVWGVCRRILDHHDAEDAFQATFLVLVRKAASLATKELLAHWLYKVALRTAKNARAGAGKRRAHERQLKSVLESQALSRDSTELRDAVDDEISRLPEKYRVVLILCDLQGKTRKEAAQALHLPEGTVASRSARGRAILASRLARYHTPLSATALAAVLSQDAAAASVPALVISTTSKAGCLVAAGQSAGAGIVPAKVAALTEGTLRAMKLTKVMKWTAFLVVIGLAGLTGGPLVYRLAFSQQPATSARAAAAPQPPAPRKNPDGIGRDMTDEERRTYAVEHMKRNLDAISQFTCRYTISDCTAPSLDDALVDRNVKRHEVWHVLWIVRKPAERFLVVTEKSLLDQPANRLIAPPGKVGPKVGSKGTYYPTVWANFLWDGTFQLRVGGRPVRVAALRRGFRGGSHPRSPGTPLEGEDFQYTAPDERLKDKRLKDMGEARVSFAGVSAEGWWEFDLGRSDERASFKTFVDPKRGFLAVRCTRWTQYVNGESYIDWNATHFEKVGQDKWFPTRSIVDMTPTWNDGEKPGIFFREWKVVSFDWKTKVADDDLAITIPAGYQIQGEDN